MKKSALLAFLMIGVLFIAGCDEGGSGSQGDVGIIINVGCTILGLLDPFLGEICSTVNGIILTVDDHTIQIHKTDGGWITLEKQEMEFELLRSSEMPQTLTFKKIPAGNYDKIRIDLKGVKVITEGGSHDAVLPDKEIIIDTNIRVDANGKSVVKLELDLAKSLSSTTEGKIVFAPVMDVETKKNVNVEILSTAQRTVSLNSDKNFIIGPNKELVKIKGGILVDKKKVGMDLDGKMKKDFILDKNLKLALKNNKVVIVEPTTSKSPPTVESPVIQTITPPQFPIKETGVVTATQTETTSTDPVAAPVQSTEATVPTSSVPVETAQNVIIVPLRAIKWKFTPNEITVTQDDTVRLAVVPNNVEFTFAIPELGVEEAVSGPTTIEFVADKVGTFEFLCSSCEDWRGMTGTIIVEGDSVAPPVAEEVEEPVTGYTNVALLACEDVISINEAFALAGTTFEYRSADRSTKTSPSVQFKNIDTGETAEMFSRLESSVSMFTLSHAGVEYNFESASNHNVDNYNIVYTCDSGAGSEAANVALTLNDVIKDWKGTWGKIVKIDYTIKNNEAGTIKPAYFIMLVEGYDTGDSAIPKRINLPSSSQSIGAGESYSLIVNVPLGFAYNPVTTGDLTSVDITLKLYDGGDREMVSVKKSFNLQG